MSFAVSSYQSKELDKSGAPGGELLATSRTANSQGVAESLS